MKKSPHILAGTLLVIASALAGCDSDSYTAPPPPPEEPPPPAPPPPVVFSEFVNQQFAATSDDADPVAVDDTEFSFDDDPAAFDGLLDDENP